MNNNNYTFNVIDVNETDWRSLLNYHDYKVLHSREYLEYFEKTKGGNPTIVAISLQDDLLGYFIGHIFKKFGFRVFGSPARGWQTSFMGFILKDGIQRVDVLPQFVSFVFNKLGCIHLEFYDDNFTVDDCNKLGLRHVVIEGYKIDLTVSEDALYKNMSNSSCRYAIRKAERSGVYIEEAEAPGFAEEYSHQLVEVYAKDSYFPPFGAERVRELIRCMYPTGNLLLLRARNAEGDCIATGIFLGLNQMVHFWGAASLKKYQHLCPNEPLIWYAMKYWKKRGIPVFEMGGPGDYKKKFGGTQIAVPRVTISRYWLIARLEVMVARTYVGFCAFKHKLRQWPNKAIVEK